MQRLTSPPRRLTILLASLAVLAMAGAGALYLWLLADLPPVSSVETRLVRPTTRILDRNGRLLYEVLDDQAGKQISLAPGQAPEACIQATLATEDSRFFLHPGVDPIAIARAAWQNLRGGTIVSGGSTLTQQLARNLLLEPEERYEQSLRRKLREGWLAWRLERRYTKDELLLLYLNQSYYGNFAFGLEAAAQIFFAKPAPQLSRAECALITGLLQYPTGYNPLQNPAAAKARQEVVLGLMHQAGYLDADEVALLVQEPLRYRSRLFNIAAPHFVMYIQDLLVERLGVDALRQGGLTVTTSLDLDLHRQAQQSVRYRLDQLNCRTPGVCDPTTDPNRRVDNAAVVVLDSRTGDILTMVGSPDYFDPAIQGNVNAALAERQPGSAIKPLTYAAAMDPAWSRNLGLTPLTPASIIADLPTTFYVTDETGGNVPYTPLNYDRKVHGPVSLRTALAGSYNIPAVKVLDRIGPPTLERMAAQAGISTFDKQYGLALTLGGGEVKLLELTAAYGILDEGARLEPRAILAVAHDGGGALPAGAADALPTEGGPPVIAPETAYLVTDILADPVARMPAFGEGSVLELPFPAAVKTGTTTDWRDNWTVGYSTRRLVGVWVGNADNTPMLGVSGIDGAGPIWHDVMVAAHPEEPPPFSRPEGVTEVTICAPSGLLPSPDCPRLRRERFIAGTEPTEPDDQFVRAPVDRATGLRAGPATPAERVEERVYWALPPAYHDWMVAQGIPLLPPGEAANGAVAGAPADMLALGAPADAPLLLTAPTSNTAYRLHPGLPRERQRIRVAGYAPDGAAWSALRLVQDGQTVLEGAQVARLEGWWELAPGTHRFWLEGERDPGGATVRSAPALVVVEPGPEEPNGAESIQAAARPAAPQE